VEHGRGGGVASTGDRDALDCSEHDLRIGLRADHGITGTGVERTSVWLRPPIDSVAAATPWSSIQAATISMSPATPRDPHSDCTRTWLRPRSQETVDGST